MLKGLDPSVKRRPINMQSGRISTKAERDAESSDLIGGTDFGVNQPLVDYNHEGCLCKQRRGHLMANAGSGGPPITLRPMWNPIPYGSRNLSKRSHHKGSAV